MKGPRYVVEETPNGWRVIDTRSSWRSVETKSEKNANGTAATLNRLRRR